VGVALTTDVHVNDSVADRDRFGELIRSWHFDQVVAANRLYLTAAVADALATERTYWALSCLPSTGDDSRFSTLSMGGQEAFAVFKPYGDNIVTAHVFVTKSVLASFGTDFDPVGLEILPSPYVAGGDDQIRVRGPWESLAPVLAERPLRTAARDFANHLMSGKTSYSRFHEDELAGRVLGII